MDGFDEKKWFVYLGDHHEGPFSLGDIQGKMSQGLVTAHSYGWAEGMGDWKPLSQIAAFDPLLNAPPKGGAPNGAEGYTRMAPIGKVEPTMMADSPNGTPEISLSLDGSSPHVDAGPAEALTMDGSSTSPGMVVDEKTGDMDPKARKKAEKQAKIDAKLAAKEEKIRAKQAKIDAKRLAKEAKVRAKQVDYFSKAKGVSNSTSLSRIVKTLFFIGMLAGGGYAYMQGYLEPVLKSPALQAGIESADEFLRPYLLMAVEKVPALGNYISPIPALKDVSAEDYEDLKAAAMRNEGAPPKVALALSKQDLTVPTFYVATTLPDGARFEIFVEGVPETLLNHLSFSAKVQAIVNRKLGRSTAVRFPDGKPAPKGDYVIYVAEAETQMPEVKTVLAGLQPSPVKISASLPKGRKLVARKAYFLGGAKDGAYLARLKDYHDKLQLRATTELGEIKQFSTTLDSQLGSSIASFTRLRKGKVNKLQQKAWNDSHGKWMQLDSQMSQTFQKWTPDALQNEYFYGLLYQMTQQAAQAVERLHGIHHSYFTGAVDAKSFDIQLGEAVSQAQTAIAALKAKVEQAEKTPPTPNGMPRREGL